MKKILLVEDSTSIREELATILRYENYQVIEAENGLKGLKIAINQKPDLILSDLNMPELDGIGLFKELNKNLATISIPFILLTASAFPQDIKYCYEIGITDCIIKPASSELIIARVKNLIIN